MENEIKQASTEAEKEKWRIIDSTKKGIEEVLNSFVGTESSELSNLIIMELLHREVIKNPFHIESLQQSNEKLLADIVKLKIELNETNNEVAHLRRGINAWQETAEQHARKEEYYRSLVVRIGELLGEESYISDDGSVQQDVVKRAEKRRTSINTFASASLSCSEKFSVAEAAIKDLRTDYDELKEAAALERKGLLSALHEQQKSTVEANDRAAKAERKLINYEFDTELLQKAIDAEIKHLFWLTDEGMKDRLRTRSANNIIINFRRLIKDTTDCGAVSSSPQDVVHPNPSTQSRNTGGDFPVPEQPNKPRTAKGQEVLEASVKLNQLLIELFE